MRRNQEEDRRKARPEPEDWRGARENNNLPPNQPQKVFNDHQRRDRPPPVHAAERDWGALRTSDPPARPPVRQINPPENNNDRGLPPPKLNRPPPERDFGNLRKEPSAPRQIIDRVPQQQPPMREEKDFGNLRAPRKIDDQPPAPISQSDQQDDWRRGAPIRKNLENENKDPRSSMPPRKIPYQPGGDRDFGNLRNNMQPRTGPPPVKRNLDEGDWRKGGDKRGRLFFELFANFD